LSRALAALIISLYSLHTLAQHLPGEIRGYKIHRAAISVHGSTARSSDDRSLDTRIRLGEPKVVDVSLTGITFEVPIEPGPVAADGTIDFLTFNDFRVNGIPVVIDEYRGPIRLKKNAPFTVPRPVTVFVSNGGVLEAGWSEFKNIQKTWVVTGRVFAFGKFKKMGLTFKRVVPIDVDVSIKNPFTSNKNMPSSVSDDHL
jgi:hypothetical protein